MGLSSRQAIEQRRLETRSLESSLIRFLRVVVRFAESNENFEFFRK